MEQPDCPHWRHRPHKVLGNLTSSLHFSGIKRPARDDRAMQLAERRRYRNVYGSSSREDIPRIQKGTDPRECTSSAGRATPQNMIGSLSHISREPIKQFLNAPVSLLNSLSQISYELAFKIAPSHHFFLAGHQLISSSSY
jgi:hypothetical protein